MPILIDINMPEWLTDQEFRDDLAPLLSGVDIRCMADPGDLTEITMLVSSRLRSGLARTLPKLRLVQKMGAGVNRRSIVTPNRRPILTPFSQADLEPATCAGGWERGAWKRAALM